MSYVFVGLILIAKHQYMVLEYLMFKNMYLKMKAASDSQT